VCKWNTKLYVGEPSFTGASEWCYRYSQTQRRCKVAVTQTE
ncbi:hypothetical protein CORC01_05384, partial [Colletotrichum orchidophilum]